MTGKHFVSWQDFERLCDSVSGQIRKAGFVPAGIYGIPRGGLPFAVRLSHLLSAPLLLAPCEGCLVVDDIADSGETLKHFEKSGYRMATLFCKPGSEVKPEFYGEIFSSDAWIVFPWEA